MAGSGTAHLRDRDDALLRVENLLVEFPLRRGAKVNAVTNLSLDVREGETLGLVGESGCGKSTTGKAIMQLPPPTGGKITFDGTEVTELKGKNLRSLRTRMQMIFQDPISSLNPRRKVEDIVGEGLSIWNRGSKDEQSSKVDEMLLTVGLDPDAARGRRPHQFSGGQCQRISIARAVVTDPKLIICDEPVSALDVSVQAQILNLLEDMKARYGLTLIFIAHDLAVVKNISDRVVVMYLGKVCEVGNPDALFANPSHPYTNALLGAIPVPDPDIRPGDRPVVAGEIPSPVSPPSGCRFRTRCPRAQDTCAEVEPEIREIEPDHFVACHFPLAPGEELEVHTDGSSAQAAEAARATQRIAELKAEQGVEETGPGPDEPLPTSTDYVGEPPTAEGPAAVEAPAADQPVEAPPPPEEREVTPKHAADDTEASGAEDGPAGSSGEPTEELESLDPPDTAATDVPDGPVDTPPPIHNQAAEDDPDSGDKP